MPTSLTAAAVSCLLLTTTPDATIPAAPAAKIVRQAGYDFRYFGKDLGEETFSISRTSSGYTIESRLSLDVGDHVPSVSTYELDQDRRFVRATYRELTPTGTSAEYRITDGVLIARGTGGAAQGERRIRLEAGAVVTGPHYVTDFFVLAPLQLAVGERHEQIAYTFGFKGWEPTRVTLKSRRDRDRRVTIADGRTIETTVYRCEIVTPKKTFRTKSSLDGDGVSVAISVGAPIGSMNVSLE